MSARGTSGRLPSAGAALLIACAVAVALGVAWIVVDSTSTGISVTVAALLAGLPIGFLLAAPLPLRLASRRGAGVGLRLSAAALSQAERITSVVLDKNGTITSGDLRVTSVDPVEPDHDRNLRWFAAALEHAADDRIGRAIAKLAGRGHLTNVVMTSGVGISGSVDRHPVRVGRPDWIGFDHPGGDGVTVAVEVDDRALGHITVDDVLRDDAADSVAALRALGLAPVLVSDATAHNTERLASAAGIEVAHSEVAASKRERVVVEQQEAGQVVAFVGSPEENREALAAADLAVSSSAPASSETSQPASLPDGERASIGLDTLDAGVVARVLMLARTTSSVIRSNQVIGLITCVLGLGLAGGGVLTPVLGLGFGALAALVVVGNSLRVRGSGPLGKRPEPSE
ncbi:hypothetical protein ASG90_03995 [Nocardioides sp. Soil797]|nr:hypothetical protein ASG90_03995 [Nocardioides sp. Soil797]